MCQNYPHSKTKHRPQPWRKLPTYITSITHCQNIRENTIAIHNKNIPIISHQHGFEHKHSTHTALHNICHQITKGFKNLRPPQHSVAVALK